MLNPFNAPPGHRAKLPENPDASLCKLCAFEKAACGPSENCTPGERKDGCNVYFVKIQSKLNGV